jgi:hypothetical protein
MIITKPSPGTATGPVSLHAVCELARLANCGCCWARPGQPCATGRDGAAGYHLARFARAERRGLISTTAFDAVLAATGQGMFDGSTIVFDGTVGHDDKYLPDYRDDGGRR